MNDRTLILRDEWGRAHRASVEADGTITLGETVVRITKANDGSLTFSAPVHARAWVAVTGNTRWVSSGGRVFTFDLDRPASRRSGSPAAHGSLSAPMPATVRAIHVAPGDEVRQGDVLVVLEAMKMELPVRAVSDGRIRAVACREGDMVQAGQNIVEME